MNMITGPTDTKNFHILQVRAALRLEVRTGMKFSNKGSVLKLARDCGYTTAKTKIAALEDLNHLCDELLAPWKD